MNFLEAMKLAIIYDKKVTRTDHVHTIWNNIKYIFYNGDILSVCSNDNKRSPYHISGSDILEDDWQIYEEKPKTYSFPEALEAFKNGKKIKRLAYDWAFTKKEFFTIEQVFSYEDVTANDWIIIEEKL